MSLLSPLSPAFAACEWAGHGPTWSRWLASLTGLAAGVRAVEILFGSDLLEVMAPIGFIVLVVATSVLLLRQEKIAAFPSSPG